MMGLSIQAHNNSIVTACMQTWAHHNWLYTNGSTYYVCLSPQVQVNFRDLSAGETVRIVARNNDIISLRFNTYIGEMIDPVRSALWEGMLAIDWPNSFPLIYGQVGGNSTTNVYNIFIPHEIYGKTFIAQVISDHFFIDYSWSNPKVLVIRP